MKALWLIGLLGLSASMQAAPTATERSTIRSSFPDLPLTFEINQGQTDRRVDFLARGEGYSLFLTATEAVFALPRRDGTSVQPSDRKASIKTISHARKQAHTVVRMQLIGSASDPRVHGLEELPGKVNYFRGADTSKWRTSVRTFRKVRYSAVYPGVDLIYYGQPQQLEYDFIVAPGADPSAIKLAFAGVNNTTVDARGDLVLNTAAGSLRFQKPLIYQLQGEHRRAVEGTYVHRRPHEIGFRVGSYDTTRPLIIDPVLSYSTYLGGSGEDSAEGIAVDASGAVYVSGTTGSIDFPTANPLQPAPGGGATDAFVAKFTPDGSALIYATYLGGSSSEGDNSFPEGRASRIAVDAAGAAYVTGITRSSDFPTVRALQTRLKGEANAFVAKLSADGAELIYSTYLGGSGREQYASIAIDLAGAAFISGSTFSTDFPTTNAFQPVCNGGPISAENAFVSKLTPDGRALAYSTYLGGEGIDAARDIAVDSLGAAYVVGITTSPNFPTVNPLSSLKGGEWDAFVSKLSPDGKALVYSTYLGGTDYEDGFGIAVDASGAAYVTGETLSEDFPTMNPVQPVHGGPRFNHDAYVVKLAPEGRTMMYATFLGGVLNDRGYRIAVDTAGAACVAGITESPDFPTTNPLQPALRGPGDSFVAKFTPDGEALVYSTYLGGNAYDGHTQSYLAIAVDPTGAAYVTGQTQSSDFPTVNPLQPAFGGGISDAFVAKISGDNLAGSPTSDNIGSQSGDRSGGGSIDALLAVLLAQFALARAFRQRGISLMRRST